MTNRKTRRLRRRKANNDFEVVSESELTTETDSDTSTEGENGLPVHVEDLEDELENRDIDWTFMAKQALLTIVAPIIFIFAKRL